MGFLVEDVPIGVMPGPVQFTPRHDLHVGCTYNVPVLDSVRHSHKLTNPARLDEAVQSQLERKRRRL
jgi:hypothetical protein